MKNAAVKMVLLQLIQVYAFLAAKSTTLFYSEASVRHVLGKKFTMVLSVNVHLELFQEDLNAWYLVKLMSYLIQAETVINVLSIKWFLTIDANVLKITSE